MTLARAARWAVPVVVLVLAGCGSSPDPVSAPTTTSSAPEPSTPVPTTAVTTATESPTPTTAGPVDWSKLPGSVDAVVTSNSGWTLTVDKDGSAATLSGPQTVRIAAPQGFSIDTTLMDAHWAVVVASDKHMTAPGVATVIPLDAPAKRYTLDGTSSPPTVYGGAWALGAGMLAHATRANHDRYCLAVVDLPTKAGQVEHCEQPRHGFNNVRITESGLTLMSFDDHRPSCRTLLQIGEASEQAIPGVTDCLGWEALALPTGTIWTEVPNANRIEVAHVYAEVDGAKQDLGPAISGTLTWCGDAAWWSQDAPSDKGSATVWRFDGTTAQQVYTSPQGPATISEPRCGGDEITVTALTQHGDEQVNAPVG